MNNADKPAYPTLDKPHSMVVDQGLELKAPGLTKRELFAMAAMQGLCANSIPGTQHQPQILASEAIEMADELLKQLEA